MNDLARTGGGLPIVWRGAPLPEAEGMRREAKLFPVLGLLRMSALAESSVAIVLSRTADLAAVDFDAAVDWMADHLESVSNPIPAIRRAAAQNAKDRAQRADEQRIAQQREAAVPMPEYLRRKLGSIVADVPKKQENHSPPISGEDRL